MPETWVVMNYQFIKTTRFSLHAYATHSLGWGVSNVTP